MAELYGDGITQGIANLHNMALTGLQTAEAMKAQEQLRQEQLANQVFANMPKLAQQGVQTQQATPAFGVAPASAFGPQPTPGSVSIQDTVGGVPKAPEFGKPGLLGSPGGKADPVQQYQAMADQGTQAAQQDPNLAMADRLTAYSNALMEAGLPQKAIEVSTHAATMRHTTLLARKDQVEAQIKQQEFHVNQIKMMASYAQRAMAQAGGDTPMAMELAKSLVLQDHPELANDPEFVGHKYEPGFLTGLQAQALTAEQAVAKARNDAKDQIDKLDKEQTRATSKATEELRKQQTETARIKKEELLKNGGRSVAQAAAAERLQISEGKDILPEVMAQFKDMTGPDGKPTSEQKMLAGRAAARASEYYKNGQAKSWAEAKGAGVVRVLAERIADGHYVLPPDEQAWVDAAMNDPRNKGATKADIIEGGFRYGRVGSGKK